MARKLPLVLLLCLLTCAAQAADEPRRIDFTAVLLDLNGKPIVDKDAPPDTGPLTLGDLAAAALTGTFRDENPSGQEKVKRMALALRVHHAKDAELTVAEIKLIMDLINKGFGTLVVARSWEMLDPTAAKQ